MHDIERDLLESERYIREAFRDIPLSVLGSRLREKRLALHLSIRDLSAKAMVSKTSIVNLEQGRSCRPSTLLKISSAMGLHVDRFLEEGDLPGQVVAVQRLEEERWFSLEGFGTGPVGGADRRLTLEERDEIRRLGSGPLMSMFRNLPLESGLVAGIIEVDSVSQTRSHPGKEFIYVLFGKALIRVGAEQFRLSEGESIFFAGEQKHDYASQNHEVARLLVVRID